VAGEEPRQRILTTARAVIAMDGRATVEDFASAAGVSRATFYRSFKSREALLEALALPAGPGARERILAAALEMMGDRGLAALSMDELADRARVSRATLYRLFPGKPALFTALLNTFSPLEPVMRLLETMSGEPPQIVMPEIARAVYRTVFAGGENRTGVMRAVFFEVSSLAPDAEEATREILIKVVGALVPYIQEQMTRGRLRTMHPLLALQAFIGPIFFHLMTRPAIERVLQLQIDGEEAVTELAEAWLRAMDPKGGGQ
jgi:AcrR family transcriptional regulator